MTSPFVFAAPPPDLCPAMFVAGLVVMFLLWLMRVFTKAQEERMTPSVRPRRTDRERQREEIEEFTRQQMARRRGREEPFLEVVEDEGVRPRPRPGTSRGRPEPSRPPQHPITRKMQSASPPVRPRAGEGAASLGENIRSHLAEYMEGRIDQSVQQHLTGLTGPAVQQLGQVVPQGGPPLTGTEHPLVRMLRDPAGVRAAVIMNEVLTRPRKFGSGGRR